MAAQEFSERRVAKRKDRSDVTINLRATRQTKELIDTAAELTGKTRSEFILETARQKAEDVLLDQRLFVMNDEQFAAFMAVLDNPPPPSAELRDLLLGKSPWEK
jgi:uncharacterized protein (DUF1778 family)